MKVILFGATGMVGSGVLRECLLDPDVEQVLSIGRAATGQSHPKLREIVHKDLGDYTAIADELAGYDACYFCLGISSAGMSEADYHRITYEFTIAAARAILAKSPNLVFVYVSGTGTDSTEKGRSMWARVKGKTENELLRMPFKAAYMFRPGYIQPVHGVKSRTGWYRAMYAVGAPLYPLWKALAPNMVTTTEHVGLAMLRAVKQGAPSGIFTSKDIEALGGTP